MYRHINFYIVSALSLFISCSIFAEASEVKEMFNDRMDYIDNIDYVEFGNESINSYGVSLLGDWAEIYNIKPSTRTELEEKIIISIMKSHRVVYYFTLDKNNILEGWQGGKKVILDEGQDTVRLDLTNPDYMCQIKLYDTITLSPKQAKSLKENISQLITTSWSSDKYEADDAWYAAVYYKGKVYDYPYTPKNTELEALISTLKDLSPFGMLLEDDVHIFDWTTEKYLEQQYNKNQTKISALPVIKKNANKWVKESLTSQTLKRGGVVYIKLKHDSWDNKNAWISNAKLQAIAYEAGKLGYKAKVVVDTILHDRNTLKPLALDTRVIIDPSKATKTLNLSGATYGDYSDRSVRDKFNKIFKNDIFILTMGEFGYGMTVKISAKMPNLKIKADSLCIYSYNKKTNKCTRIRNAIPKIEDGYIHFYTHLGNYIIISNGPLNKR